uniref:Uncharacterized protein n=1 Tax=Pyramimonas obovata TaxID=1411642 RepID=A0A7S0QTP4_9CHLO|mmetsp:Transcript_11178/g.23307  ORF Transcript_11178/g.23307 Transcript_11178/m.23307 type:complete len:466 (+) Transcript_11178:313-1710(+)
MSLVPQDDDCSSMGFLVGQIIKTPAGRKGRVLGAHYRDPKHPEKRLWVEYDDQVQRDLEALDEKLNRRIKSTQSRETHRTVLAARGKGTVNLCDAYGSLTARGPSKQQAETLRPTSAGFLLPAREVSRLGSVKNVSSTYYARHARKDYIVEEAKYDASNAVGGGVLFEPASPVKRKQLGTTAFSTGDIVLTPLGERARVVGLYVTESDAGKNEELLWLEYAKGGDGPLPLSPGQSAANVDRVFRVPEESTLTYVDVPANESVQDGIKLSSAKLKTPCRLNAPIWGNNCAPAILRNTTGGICAPSKCRCRWPLVHHGPGDILAPNPPYWLNVNSYFYGPSAPDHVLNATNLADPAYLREQYKAAMLPSPPTFGKSSFKSSLGPTRSKYAILKAYMKKREGEKEYAALERKLHTQVPLPTPPVATPMTNKCWGAALRPRPHVHRGRVITCLDNSPDVWCVPVDDAGR